MHSNFTEIIRYASIFSIAIPIFTFVINLKDVSIHGKIIAGLLVLSAMSDFLANYFFQNGKSVELLYNIYSAIQFGLLSWYYYESLFRHKYKNLLSVGSIIYALSFLLITIFVQDIFHYQNMLWAISGAILIVYGVKYFAHLMRNFGYWGDQGGSAAWFNMAVFSYFCFNLGLFVMSEYIFSRVDSEATLTIWSIHNMANIFKNVMFAVGFIVTDKRN